MSERNDTDSSLLRQIEHTISRHSLLQPGDKVIVALSGGADSVALLSALVELGYDCVAAHCNFHLRGAESMRDMHHSENLCRRLGVDLAVKDFDVPTRRKATGESVEMACRALRYEWFDRLLTRERARAIAVGHHREDNIETIMLNLFRGTGIDGLRGMQVRRDYIIRPMLGCSRDEIERYLSSRGLSYITDSSNSSDAHLRNRLRNNVLPETYRNFHDAERAILATAANLDAAARIYSRAIDLYRRRFVDDQGHIMLADLISELGEDAPTVLRELIKRLGLSPHRCDDIITSATHSGLRFEAGNGVVLELDRGILTPSRPGLLHHADYYSVDLNRDVLIPVNLRISRHHISEFKPERDPNVIYLDANALEASTPWTLRRWKKGDRMRPFGMKGSRLVSDIFNDARYSAADKRNAWLLACGDKIEWIVGLRAGSSFPVTPDTRTYLKIIYKR